jgi:hypothetical protein
MHPLLNAIDTIWYYSEIIPPNCLLGAVEHGMISGNNLQQSTCDTAARAHAYVFVGAAE